MSGRVLVACAAGLLGVGLPVQAQEALPLSTLPLQLAAVMVDKQTPWKSACLIKCGYTPQRQSRLLPGQIACEIAEIKDVRVDGVVIDNRLTHRLEFLALTTAAPSPTARRLPPPPSVTVTAAGVTVDVPQSTVDYYVANLPEVLDSAVASPRFRDAERGDRTIEGYEIGKIKASGVIDQLGLQNGDVVLDVNGQPLGDIVSIIQMFGQMQNMTQVKLTVLRNGQRLPFQINRK